MTLSKSLFSGLAGLWLIAAPYSVHAQVVIDWGSKSLVSYPQIVNKQITTTVVVNNVNDILYQYKVALTATAQQQTLDDAASLLDIGQQATNAANAMKAAGLLAKAPDACQAGVTSLNQNVQDITKNVTTVIAARARKDTSGNPVSVSLQETVSAWNSSVRPVLRMLTGPQTLQGSMAYVAQQCTGDEKTNLGDPSYARAQAVVPDILSRQQVVDGHHQIQQTIGLAPNNNYSVTVNETNPDTGDVTATLTETFNPSSTILTLSLGTLLSEIQQRSYSSVTDPSNTGQNLLSVNGTGRFTPLGTALLNYELISNKSGNYGLTVSSGLVLGFGETNVSASSLGWFGGLSGHLYHRFFLTAGAHVGQFADFPTGLARGSVIPANYGDLNGVNRTTTRFGFAVTYQTKDFQSATTAKASDTATQPAANTAAQPSTKKPTN